MTAPAPVSPDDPRTRLATLPHLKHWIFWPAVGALIVVLFGVLVKDIGPISRTELYIDQFLTRHQNPAFGALALLIQTAFSPAGSAVILAVSFLFLLFVRRSPVNAFAFTSVAAFGYLSSELFKQLVAMPRPNGQLLAHPLLAEVGHDSFPSGHTTFAASFAIAAILLALRTRWVKLTTTLGVLLVLVVAASRLYAGAHYLSDVVGSVLVALTAIAFYSGLWNRFGLIVLGWLPFLKRIGPVPARRPQRGRRARTGERR